MLSPRVEQVRQSAQRVLRSNFLEENIQHSTSNIEHLILNLPPRSHGMLDVRCWLLDILAASSPRTMNRTTGPSSPDGGL